MLVKRVPVAFFPNPSNAFSRRPPALRFYVQKEEKIRFLLCLGGGDGLADAGTTLPGVETELLAVGDILGLLDNLLALSEDKLNVAGVGHVRVDTTVGTVCPPALLGSLVDLDVLDDEGAGIETLGVGVGLGVLEETEEELSRLDGPAGPGDTELLALSGTASATGVSSHGDSLLVLLDVLEEGHGTLELPAVDGLGGLAGVLEGDTEVGTAGAGRLGGLDLSRCVSDHLDGFAGG
jgi:hypothetical protein